MVCLLLFQKTGKAILAITRMRGSFLRMNSAPSLDGDATTPSPTSPPQRSIPEESTPEVFSPEDRDKKFASTPDEEEKTPTGDSLISDFHYPASCGEDKKLHMLSEGGSSEDDVTPLTSRDHSVDKDHMSDAMDSGYGGRKLTSEILCEETEEEVEESQSPPIFIHPFADENHVIEGDCARLDVEMRLSNGLKVCWYRDGERIPPDSDRFEFEEEEGCKFALIIKDVKSTDDAEYECRARNDFGQESCFGEMYVVRND